VVTEPRHLERAPLDPTAPNNRKYWRLHQWKSPPWSSRRAFRLRQKVLRQSLNSPGVYPAIVRTAFASSRESEDLGSVLGDRDRVLEVRGEFAVFGHDAPPVVEHVRLVGATFEPSVRRQRPCPLSTSGGRAGPVVLVTWGFRHLGADGVADVFAHGPKSQPPRRPVGRRDRPSLRRPPITRC